MIWTANSKTETRLDEMPVGTTLSNWVVALLLGCSLALTTGAFAHAPPPETEEEPAPALPDEQPALPTTATMTIDAPGYPGHTSGCGGWGLLHAEAPATTADPVYLRQGAVVEQASDLLHPGPVQAFSASRSYSSRSTGSAILGGKWVGQFCRLPIG